MYRPFGDVAWIIERLGNDKWSFLGCISHEDRCLSAYSRTRNKISNSIFARIFDEDPEDIYLEGESLDKQSELAISLGIDSEDIFDVRLLSTIDVMHQLLRKSIDGNDRLIIDITSMPKRWFFPIIRLAMQMNEIKDIVICYTLAFEYASSLSFNPETAKWLPMFDKSSSSGNCDIAFVGVGYHSSSISQIFDTEKPKSINLLFPFPPGPPGIKKNWNFVEQTEKSIGFSVSEEYQFEDYFQHIQVAAKSVSENFDTMVKLSNNGSKTCIVAPYGPKTVSLAMCLFSLAYEKKHGKFVPASYSQPMRYSMKYSSGVNQFNGEDEVECYPIKLNGRELFSM